MKRIAKYETNDASIGMPTSRISHALLNKKWARSGIGSSTTSRHSKN